ncbi:CinA family nicotinamide mononucleotide deamidase-related protein [Flavobacterium ardleyense]|uniref:CinA family nicotinamide mononucleotide deamidase-related protein n=1 Tax=Flavobacterium ardleyense TaxID=2038737 RepID=UPI00298C020B|nr:CinA family nicotinamide mononucleotide deamidase-related protein [Flavobacterium ardleyense]
MKASIVTIGDEILIGQILDTNSQFIAKSLDKIGIEIKSILSISDDAEQIKHTFQSLQNEVDIVLITGGLGPTKDDLTKKVFCDYFEDTLIVNEEVLAHVTKIIEEYYKRPISRINKDQALVPSTAIILKNVNGTAPGMWMKKQDTVYVSLPGVPFEMKAIILDELIPKIIKEYKRSVIIHQTIITFGQGESLIAERLEDWENNLPETIKLAYLPSAGKVRLRLSARGDSEREIKDLLAESISQLVTVIGDIIIGMEEDETLEASVSNLMRANNLSLATAESCTGGKISQILTELAGASTFFKGAIVPYDTSIKIDVLGISSDLIKEHSVVSSAVARQMALSVQRMFKTDYAVSTTGNAGPSKGDSDAVLGTVFIAIATPKEVIVEEFNFGQPREKVIDRAVNQSLEMLRKEILKNLL